MLGEHPTRAAAAHRALGDVEEEYRLVQAMAIRGFKGLSPEEKAVAEARGLSAARRRYAAMAGQPATSRSGATRLNLWVGGRDGIPIDPIRSE